MDASEMQAQKGSHRYIPTAADLKATQVGYKYDRSSQFYET